MVGLLVIQCYFPSSNLCLMKILFHPRAPHSNLSLTFSLTPFLSPHFDRGRATWCLCKPPLFSLPLISRTASISAALMNEACTLPLCHVDGCSVVVNADKRLLRGDIFFFSKSVYKISNTSFVLDNDRVSKSHLRGGHVSTEVSCMCPLNFFGYTLF